MSYAAVPRRGPYAMAGYNDLPGVDPSTVKQLKPYATAAASTVSDQAKAQAVAFAQQQLQNYPSAAEVLSQYNAYAGYLKAIPGFNVEDLKDPKKCAALMKQALINYAHANGYPTNKKEAEQQLAAYAASIASSELGVSIPPHWPSNLKDLKSVAVDIAVTAVVMETGFDAKDVTVIVDTLLSGTLTESQCEAMGAAAGAIAGAVVCQAFGIPAPIGAFIGALIGKDIGGTFAEIFSVGESATHDVQGRLASMTAWEKSILSQAQAICASTRTTYWGMFDQLLAATELQWRAAEVKIGWKFGLRWFGIETWSTTVGLPFSHAYDPRTKTFPYTGPLTTANRAVQVRKQLVAALHDENGQNKLTSSYEYTYGCPFDFGCPYPVVPGLASPQGYERDAQAFFARGALWIPPSQRSYQCSFPFPPQSQTNFSAFTDQWAAAVQGDLNNEANAVKALQILSVAVIADLVRTAAANAGEKKVLDSLRLSSGALQSAQLARGQALAQAKITGKNLSDLLNYGTLALGAGLVFVALKKRRR
jgi:hypothetical protein